LHTLLELAVEEAKQVYRGLKVKPVHVTGIASKNVMVLLMYTVMRKRNATDFGIRNPKPFDQIQGSKLQPHHIFPFDFMMKGEKVLAYKKEHDLPQWMYREEVDDIANMTFLSRESNEGIGNISPWHYLENETSPGMRRAHLIPEDRDLWKPDNFARFLELRRTMLAKGLRRRYLSQEGN